MLEIALRFGFEAIQQVRWQIAMLPAAIEAGGLLAGMGDNVRWALPAANEADDPAAFVIGAGQMAMLLKQIDWLGLELIGTYHSHPNGNAQMSSADAAMARSTGVLLIVAPGSPWQWRLWDPVAAGEVGFAIAPPRA